MKATGALSLLTVASAASAFHLPVSRIKPRASLPASLERRGYAILAASGSLTLSNRENNIYTSKMQIKGKDVIMQVDTGSSDTWLYPTRETRDLYTDAVVYTDMPLKLEYGRGAVAGYVGQMTLDFAGYTVQNQSILIVQEQHDMSLIEANLTHGLLGLGFDTLSKIANGVAGATGGQNWGRTILSNIFASDPTTPNHIAFRLDRTGDGNETDIGAFDIGTFAPGLEAVANTPEIPIFSNNAEANIYWNVLVDGVTINGQAQTLTTSVTGDRVPPAGKASALLDTGYSLPQLTPALAHAIYSAMGGVLIEDDTNTTYAVPCTAEAQVVFSIGGHAIPIHPLDLTQVQIVSTQSGQNYTWCMNAFQPFSSNAGGGQLDYILGDAFLRNVYSVYDYGDYVRGFSGLATGDPYIKLLPLTDATAASTEFKTARAAELNAAGMPPQLDPTTVNGDLKAIPGTGGGSGGGSGGSGGGGSTSSGNGAGQIGMGVWTWVVAAGLGLAGFVL